MTVHDLARLAQVNSSTVSRALRNDPRVKESTRSRILELAAQHGYTPNVYARSLAAGKTGMAALLIGSLEYTMEREMAVRLNGILARAGMTLMLLTYAPEPEKFFGAHLERLSRKICDAAAILPPSEPLMGEAVKRQLSAIRMPLVFVDRWVENSSIPAVTTDNESAMKQLLEKTIAEGAETAVLHFGPYNTVSRSRRDTLIRLLKERKMDYCFSNDLSSLPLSPGKVAVFANNAPGITGKIPGLPREFITAAFDGFVPAKEERRGKIFLCRQDFGAIAEEAARYLTGTADNAAAPGRITGVKPAEIVEIE